MTKLFKKKKAQGRQSVGQPGRPKAAFSYYSGDTPKTKDSVRARQHKDNQQEFFKRLRSVPTLIALLIILLSVVYSTTLSTEAIVKFAGDSPTYRTATEYRDGVSKILSTSFWNKSKLTSNTHQTETAILQAFPELDAANVALPVVGRRPTIVVHGRMPALLLTNQAHSYVIDTSGKIVADSTQLVSSVREKLLSVQDQSGLELRVGNQAVTSATVIFILNIQAQLKNKQLAIKEVILPKTPNEVDFRIKDIGYFIKTDSSGDARLQAGDFLAAKGSGITPGEYMDVRVEEKVFYK